MEVFMDRLIKGFACDGQVRLIGVSTTELVQKALDIHGLSPVAVSALGRLLTGGAMMGAMLKNDNDRLTLMLKGDGPLGNIVVCSNSKSVVKGYVQNPVVDIPLNGKGNLDVGGAVGKSGLLTVVRDIGLKQPESGSVNITTGEIGHELAEYFLVSEQVPTAIEVGLSVTKDAKVSASGGYLIQLMPGTDSAIIDMIEGRIKNMLPANELLKKGFSLEEILMAVSGDDNITILDEMHPEFLCDCSRERMEQALNSISFEERKNMIEQDGFIEMKCSFCGRTERWK
jgi:molecular chaperone Hsp33